MTSSVNKVILVGNLGRDPVIRRTQDGRHAAARQANGQGCLSEWRFVSATRFR